MAHKQMSSKMVSSLVKSIRGIPTQPNRPWSAREAMELFVQHALVGLILVGKKSAFNELDASFYGPNLASGR